MIYNPKDLRIDLDVAINNLHAGPPHRITGLLQLAWVLVKLVRHGRVRCRNNKALYNYLGSAFPELRFDEVPKTIEYGHRKGQKYMGLKLTNRETGDIVEANDDENDD
jgi:hypothetical protein